MCDNKTLSHSEGGYIFQCLQCGLFQLAYGTSLISFSPEQFGEFRQQVRARLASHPQDGFPHHKCIALQVYSEHSYMILCYLELKELMELLNEAWFAAELRDLVGDLTNLDRHGRD